jgi:ADP-ribose pyrophosphatase YjhB (NUDIX family)
MTRGDSGSPHADRREYPTRPVVGVGAVIVVPEGAAGGSERGSGGAGRGIVLIRRRFEPLAGQWSLPGGALEVGETLEAGVAREVLEETGLAVDVGPVIEVFDRIVRDDSERVRYHYVLIDYLCRPVGGRLCPGSDVSAAIVADPAALEPYALTEKALSVIARGLQLRDMLPVPDA